jgi:hypothetical protein
LRADADHLRDTAFPLGVGKLLMAALRVHSFALARSVRVCPGSPQASLHNLCPELGFQGTQPATLSHIAHDSYAASPAIEDL